MSVDVPECERIPCLMWNLKCVKLYNVDVQYVHYSLDVFSHDSNYTIRSMAKLLLDLELPPKSSS